MKIKTLLIDDMRNLKADKIARTYDDGIKALESEQWDVLLLDHDLGCFDKNGREWTGYDVMCWLETHLKYLPTCDIRVVSSNPAGRIRMESVINKLYANR